MSVIQSFYFRGEVDGYEAGYTDSRSRLLSSSEKRLAARPTLRLNGWIRREVCIRGLRALSRKIQQEGIFDSISLGEGTRVGFLTLYSSIKRSRLASST